MQKKTIFDLFHLAQVRIEPGTSGCEVSMLTIIHHMDPNKYSRQPKF